MAKLTPEQIKASYWEARAIVENLPVIRFARRMGETAKINGVDLGIEEDGRTRGSGCVGQASKAAAGGGPL